MDGSAPNFTLTVVTDELRQFAGLAPLATVSPVSASVQATPPLAGAMPESASAEAHVRFCVETAGTFATQATTGIGTLIDAALSFAGSYDEADLVNALTQRALADQLPSATDQGSASQD